MINQKMQASLATWTQGTKQSVVAGDAQKRSDSGIFNDNDALLELEDDDIDMEAIRAKVRGQLKGAS